LAQKQVHIQGDQGMDAKIEAVLAEYEAREQKEMIALHAFAKGEGPPVDRDEMLVPIGHDVGVLLSTLIKSHKCKTILEIGTSYGNSTVWFAEAARETGGKVISLELAQKKVDYAKTMIEKAGLSDYVEFIVGDANDSIRALPGPFDFVLVDHWKEYYVDALELFYPKLADGALIAADNMIFPPMTEQDALRYRRAVRSKPNIQSLLLDTGQGVELSRFQKPL
jgi:predicted O-methyltransferase YrrM